MKKSIVIAAAMALALCGCGAKGAEQTATQTTEETTEATTETKTEMANPWSEAKTADEAGQSAGVGYFVVPEDGTQSTIGPINWYGFQYMEGVAQADGGIGAATLTVRKGLKQDTTDVSGDYNKYAYSWTQQVDVWEVTCFGNEEGKAMKALWLSDNFSYSIIVRGQGDLVDTFGIGQEDVAALVNAVQ